MAAGGAASVVVGAGAGAAVVVAGGAAAVVVGAGAAGCSACHSLMRTTAVPSYGDLFSGTPRSAYSPRLRVTTTTGAPLSTTFVPGAGSCVTTTLLA